MLAIIVIPYTRKLFKSPWNELRLLLDLDISFSESLRETPMAKYVINIAANCQT